MNALILLINVCINNVEIPTETIDIHGFMSFLLGKMLPRFSQTNGFSLPNSDRTLLFIGTYVCLFSTSLQ